LRLRRRSLEVVARQLQRNALARHAGLGQCVRGRQLLIDQLGKFLIGLRAAQHLAVHAKMRRAIDSELARER